MWTPKRIVMLVVGFFAFFSTYVAYAHFMGGIDGLPMLPEIYLPYPGKALDYKQMAQPVNEATKKLCQAFGEDCDEVKNRSIKVVLNDRGLVLATDECNPEPDGRMKLKPFSLAIFGKPKGTSSYPEINTIRSATALITFDRPVKSQMDMGNRKIVSAELQGTITITNNRGTPQKTDDIEVTIMGEPLYYAEADHHVWSEGTVRMLDTQNVPYPTRVTANGIDLYLTTGESGGRKAESKEQRAESGGGKEVGLSASGSPPSAPRSPLSSGSPPPAGEGRGRRGDGQKTKTESINGVDHLILRRNVHMNLYVDARNGFPGSSPGAQPAKEPRKRPSENLPHNARVRDSRTSGQPLDPERAYVVIDTSGPFVYDTKKDLATFDIPPEASEKPNLEYQVIVCREHNPGQGRGPLFDQLVCKHLELQFRKKKKGEAPAKPGEHSPDREIDSAHAIGDVRLALDTESLEAQGDDLVYVAPVVEKGNEKGPQTTLTGAPLWAVKDCNVIQAKKLWLRGASHDGKQPSRATALGPGKIDLADHPTDNPRHPIHVYWKDMLISDKDPVTTGLLKDGKPRVIIYDKLTLTGGASFVDDDHKQQLHGMRLELWLEPAEHEAPARGTQEAFRQATPAAEDRSRMKPYRLEAYKHVSAHSPDMNIQQADRLTVWFHDLAESLPAVPGGKKAEGTGSVLAPRPSPVASAAGSAAAPPAPSSEPPRKPVNLKARVVVAHVNRTGQRNELKNLVAEGTVHVHQEGKDVNDRGVEITGETLELIQYPKGDLPEPPGDRLVVLGNTGKPAYLQLGDLIMVGPKVTIDQKENNAEVQGIGYMNMPSNTSFEGGKPAHPGARLEVHWNTGMVFDGREANFYGGVIATQDTGRLQGNTLQVTLDRSVSLKATVKDKESGKGPAKEQSAKVEKMVCDGKVYVEDTVKEKGKLVRYSRLVCHGLAMDNQPAALDRQGAPNQPGSTIADGPGIVTLIQPGAVDTLNGPVGPSGSPAASAPTGAAAKPVPEEMKLTRIEFETRMRTDTIGTSRRAIFYDNVEVVNLPSDKPDIPVDKDHLPEHGLHLQCANKLTVFSITPQATAAQPTPKASQVMIAEGKVKVTTPEFQAYATRVSYEEAKDLLIFEGTEQNQATFFRLQAAAGIDANSFRGRKIFFWRTTRQFKIEDGGSILNFK